jgi:hypothetical protein
MDVVPKGGQRARDGRASKSRASDVACAEVRRAPGGRGVPNRPRAWRAGRPEPPTRLEGGASRTAHAPGGRGVPNRLRGVPNRPRA